MFPNLNAGAIGVRVALPEVIRLAGEFGFQGIDFSIAEAMSYAGEHGYEQLASLFRRSDVRPGSWGFPVDFRKDEATWQDGLERLPAQAEFARRLGCLRTTTWLMPGDDERDFRENFAFHVARLRPAAQILADNGISIGLEFVGPRTLRRVKRFAFLHTLEGVRSLAAAIGTGNVGILLDSFHLYTSHGTVDDVRELAVDEIVVVHINDAPKGVAVDEQIDNVRALPVETGVLDMASFLGVLASMGYEGPVTAEPFSQHLCQMDPVEAVAATYAAVRRAWTQAGLAFPSRSQ